MHLNYRIRSLECQVQRLKVENSLLSNATRDTYEYRNMIYVSICTFLLIILQSSLLTDDSSDMVTTKKFRPAVTKNGRYSVQLCPRYAH